MQYLNAAYLFPRRDGRRQRRGQLDDGFQGAALALGHQAVSGAFVVQRDCRRRAVLHGQRLRRVAGQRGGCALIVGKAVIQQRTG